MFIQQRSYIMLDNQDQDLPIPAFPTFCNLPAQPCPPCVKDGDEKYPKVYAWQCTERIWYGKSQSELVVILTAEELGFMVAEPLNYCTDRNYITYYAFTPEARKIVDDLMYSDYEEPKLPYGFTISVKSNEGLKPIIGWTATTLYSLEGHTWDKNEIYSYVLTHLYDTSFYAEFYAVYEAIECAIHIEWKLDNN